MRNRHALWLSLLSVVLCMPAFATLNGRSAVSLAGLDTNPCTPASPCRSFGTAIAATAAGGEIVALDSGGYGPFTLNVPMTISGAPGVHAAITASAGAGVTVNVSSTDKVILRNLVIIGSGGATGGIVETNALELTVIGCLIRGFSGSAILVDTNARNLSVQRCAIVHNPGIAINFSAASSTHQGTVNDSLIEDNGTGVSAGPSSRVVVTNTTLTENGTGAQASCTTGMGLTATLTLKRCTIVHGGYGAAAISSGMANSAIVTLTRNVVAFNVYGVYINALNGAVSPVHTFTDNRFVANNSDVPFGGLTTSTYQ